MAHVFLGCSCMRCIDLISLLDSVMLSSQAFSNALDVFGGVLFHVSTHAQRGFR